MTRKGYTPTPLAPVTAEIKEERSTLIFHRNFRQSPEKVWEALTDPKQLAEWAPYISDRNLATEGSATLIMTDGMLEETFPATVTRAIPPSLLEYDWSSGLLVWELTPQGEGTHLTLRHTVKTPDWLPKVAAGWHMCLDVMEKLLGGHPIGRIVGKESMDYGWGSLHEAYAKALNIEPTGFPKE